MEHSSPFRVSGKGAPVRFSSSSFSATSSLAPCRGFGSALPASLRTAGTPDRRSTLGWRCLLKNHARPKSPRRNPENGRWRTHRIVAPKCRRLLIRLRQRNLRPSRGQGQSRSPRGGPIRSGEGALAPRSLCPRMICTHCYIIGVDALPNWSKRAAEPARGAVVMGQAVEPTG